MSSVSTHVLDTALGKPAAGIHAVLEVQTQVGEWTQLGHTATDGDGRIKSFVPSHVSLAPASIGYASIPVPMRSAFIRKSSSPFASTRPRSITMVRCC